MSLLLVTLLTTLVSAAPEGAERFAQARQAAASLDYDRALALAQDALNQGDSKAETTLKLYVFQAEMAAVVGLSGTATVAYARALLLNPSLELPLNPSPRLLAPYRKAKGQVGSARLSAVPVSTRSANGFIKTKLRVEGDIFQWVSAAKVIPQEGPPQQLSRTDGYEGHWPCTREPCAHVISLNDAMGNELLRIGSAESPLLVLEPAVAARPPPPPLYKRSWPYFIAGGLAAGVGTVFAVQTARADTVFRDALANPGQHTYAQTAAFDAARRGPYTASVTGFAVAAAVSAVGLFWWIKSP